LPGVSPELPAVIAAAIERCDRPSLVFDLARIDDNLAAIAGAARAAGITVLFAAKSFPHPAVRALAAARLDGFDVASPGELADVAALAADRAQILSVADPSGRAIAAAAAWRGRLIVSCETVAQVAAAPPHAEIAIRISASLTGRDPAIGAVLDGSGHRRSRFGLDVDPARLRAAIAALARAAGGRPLGLHMHHGPVAATSSERFIATARAMLAAAEAAGVAPRFLDLGGAWHAIADLPGTLSAIRAALPAALALILEPGRRIAEGAGFACGRVAVARELDDRGLCVLDVSRSCHLRWSQPALVAAPPRTGAGRATLFVGPTCYEDDVLGDWTVEPARFPAGGRVVLRNVTGYAVGWNTGFGGVAPADVVIAG
jgi:2-[(L-alanin-3-ylcarbamoyl)methyl]-2-hydroxybutanedioate decarboxylase